MELIEEIYNGARLQGRGLGVRMSNFKKFWELKVSSSSQKVRSGYVTNHSVKNLT
ncbi:trimethylamine-N-oxide reductase [Photobacterium aphoticum]|uniref:Trimethylamine-N-oxide reductase n=1 Tax=Photobacterium aphoticum TaxID=754436 RepID=A0A090QWA3_9GAMM|nr:trimethylamine-N-oxide reductase [Photobacterium aphoticum]